MSDDLSSSEEKQRFIYVDTKAALQKGRGQTPNHGIGF